MARSRIYTIEAIKDSDYADDLVLPSNIPAQPNPCFIACYKQKKALSCTRTLVME